jgi:zinc D-Ala-D-Ala carboxypeptidase
MNITPNFTIEEMTVSQTAIRFGLDNTLPHSLYPHMLRLCISLEEVRALLGHPLIITSGYRSLMVNRAFGSRDTSAHTKALAGDLICPHFGSPSEVAQAIAASDIAFDQLIQEGAWVHFSVPLSGPGRRDKLTASFGPHNVTYSRGIA